MPVEPYFPKVIPFTIAGAVAAFMLSILGVLAITLISGIGSARAPRPARLENEVMVETSVAEPKAEIEEISEPVENQPVTAKSSPMEQLENIIMGNSQTQIDEPPEIVKTPGPLTMTSQTETSVNQPETPLGQRTEPTYQTNAIPVRYAASVFQDLGEGRIVVVSPGGDDGSKTAWVLARQLDREGENGVVIIDLSGEGATATAMLGGNDLPGIFNLVSGAVSVNNIIYRDQKSGVHVVPSGTLFHGAPAPDMQTMSDIIDAIALSYDYCIVDCGDTDLDGINLVATDDAIVIISGINAPIEECNLLEAELKEDGFKDILHLIPDDVDQQENQSSELA